MDPPTHVIDPDGEVIIILCNANTPFADWDDDVIADDTLSQAASEPSEHVHNHAEEIEVSDKYTVPMVSSRKEKKKKRKQKQNLGETVGLYPEPVAEPVAEPVPEPIPETFQEPLEEPFEGAVPGPVPGSTEAEFVGEPTNPEYTGPYQRPNTEHSNHNEDANQQYSCDEDLTERNFRIQVSAKHLTLASSVFKKILTGGWKEGHLSAKRLYRNYDGALGY